MRDVKRGWLSIPTHIKWLIWLSFVCSMAALNLTAGIPRLFRTYDVPKRETYNCMIWEAARATSATPAFFKSIVIGGQGSLQPYIDGGMGCNNPISQVLEEAELVFPGQNVTCIISIGSGQGQVIGVPKQTWFQRVLPLEIIKVLQGIVIDCERSAQEIANRFRNTSDIYF